MKRSGFELSRRGLMGAGAALMGMATPLGALAAAAGRVTSRISDVQTMIVKGNRTYVYVRILTNDGHFGIGEAYGSPGVAVAEQIKSLKPWLVGKNPLEIDRIYTTIGDDEVNGSRTDGSAHGLLRAVSGIEMALWDLAGRILGTPTSVLMGGQFRSHVRVYDHIRLPNLQDKGAVREWAARTRESPSGFTAHKVNIPRTQNIWADKVSPELADNGRDQANRVLSTKEISRTVKALENIREAIGWEHDLMLHCHWEFDLRTSIQLAQAIAPIKPLFLEDPLPVDYSDSWRRLVDASPVPIMMGENLARREGFQPFLVNQACDIINPDLRNSGGFLETKRIADMASVFQIPMCTHNTASQLHTYQVCQWASSVRDFYMCETTTGRGGWGDQILKLDGPYIQKGHIKVSDKPGTGVELNREVVEAHLEPGQVWWGDV